MENIKQKEIGVGVIGFGGFALFSMQQFMQIQGIKFVGIAGTYREAAEAAIKRFDAKIFDKIEDLLNSPEVNLIYIATPPFLHYEQSLMALKAGKHVICEKPLATKLEHAEELVSFAKEKGLLMSVNLMQRYNPVYQKVKELIDSKALGDVLHGFFENYATNEFLPDEHWFWNKEQSGGIFIEHGVHFFDMFEGWIGKGKIVSAQSTLRPGTSIEDQVQCQAIYNDSIPVNYYHGFTQAARMDRQELRLLFEKGDVTLYEWIPIRVTINAIADEADTKTLMKIFNGASLDIITYYMGEHRKVRYRDKNDDIYQMVSLKYGYENQKMVVYGNLVKSFFADQVAWIRDKNHERIITEENGYNSLSYAVEAEKLAHKIFR